MEFIAGDRQRRTRKGSCAIEIGSYAKPQAHVQIKHARRHVNRCPVTQCELHMLKKARGRYRRVGCRWRRDQKDEWTNSGQVGR